MNEKKEHVATDELRQLLTTDVPLSQMLAQARLVKPDIDELKPVKQISESKRSHRYTSTSGTTHELAPYETFLQELIRKSHLIIDARRESLRILVAAQHKHHRITLMLNVEDLFANWFDVPIGVLIPDGEHHGDLVLKTPKKSTNELDIGKKEMEILNRESKISL